MDFCSLTRPPFFCSGRNFGSTSSAAPIRSPRRRRILLLAGLATRFAALGLLIMTGVIQLTVPEGWANFHLPWAAMLFAILVYGPGELSADRLIARGRR
jgi:hypothetical protein